MKSISSNRIISSVKRLLSQILLTAFLGLAFSGTAFAATNEEVAGLYEGLLMLDSGNEPMSMRLSADGEIALLNPDELEKESPGVGYWKIVGSEGANVKVKIVYEQYFAEQTYGCKVNKNATDAASHWGCMFHVAIDAAIAPDGTMSGIMSVSGSTVGVSQNALDFTIREAFPVDLKRISFDDLYNRAKGTPVP